MPNHPASRRLDGVTVLFDLDGTLIDTAADLAAAMNHVLTREGLPALPVGEVRHLVGRGAKAMLRAGLAKAGREPGAGDEAEEALEARVGVFLEYYRAHIADFSTPFPGVLDAIRVVRDAGARVNVCTNKREAPARQLLAALDMTSLFDVIVGGDTTEAAKPDPAPVLRSLNGGAPARAVFIGDSDTDIRASIAAGMPCLIANFGYGPLDLRDQAFATFDDYADAPALIAKASGL